jgi:hypothetical protein
MKKQNSSYFFIILLVIMIDNGFYEIILNKDTFKKNLKEFKTDISKYPNTLR